MRFSGYVEPGRGTDLGHTGETMGLIFVLSTSFMQTVVELRAWLGFFSFGTVPIFALLELCVPGHLHLLCTVVECR